MSKKIKFSNNRKIIVIYLVILIGFIMFVVGWLNIVYFGGVDIVKRPYVISIPRKYFGEIILSPEGEQKLGLKLIAEAYNVSVREGAKEDVISFSTNTSYIWATIKVKGRTLNKNFVDMVVYLNRVDGTVVGGTRITNKSDIIDSEYILTLGSLNEGNYTLEILSNSHMFIEYIALRGLRYEVLPGPVISIAFSPEEFYHHTLYYIDRIDFRGLWMSMAIITIGFITIAVALLLYISMCIPIALSRTEISKTKKRKSLD